MITGQNNLASMVAQYRANQAQPQAAPVAQPAAPSAQPQPMPTQRAPMSLALLYGALQGRGMHLGPGDRMGNAGFRPNWF